MAGMESGEVEPFQVIKRPVKLLASPPEMKPADDIMYPVLPADFFCILHRVAYPCMGAPGDHHNPLATAVGKGSIIDQAILLHAPVRHHDTPWPGQGRLKGEHPLDLAKEEQIRRETDRGF